MFQPRGMNPFASGAGAAGVKQREAMMEAERKAFEDKLAAITDRIKKFLVF